MKKFKQLTISLLLTALLVFNVLATTTAPGSTGWWSDLYQTVVNFVIGTSTDDCVIRVCQTCKPLDPDCRPGGR